MRGPLRPKYLQKTQKKNKYLAKNNEKKQEKTFVKGSAGAHKTRAIFQGLTLKNGMDIGVWRNFGVYAWTSLYNPAKHRNKRENQEKTIKINQ